MSTSLRTTSDASNPQITGQRRVAGWAPALVATLCIAICMIVADTPLLDMLRYGLYLIVALMAPGVLVHRALRGRPDNIVADLSLGGAVGVAVGLFGWAIFMTLGIQKFLWAWPLLIIALFLAVPKLRKNWTIAPYPERVGALSSWLLAAAVAFYTLALAVEHWHGQPMPPAPNFYYIDVYWHLANVAELTKDLPPDTPSVAGRTLHYHWFVNAHVAVGHMLSGVGAPVTYMRLWEPPFVAIVLGLMFTLARTVTKRWWGGALAALLLVLPTQLMPWDWYKPFASFALTEGSPSQTFGVLIVLLSTIVMLPLLRGRSIGWGSWLVLAAAAILGGGAKPAVLPMLLFGLGVVFLVRLFRRERPWGVLAAMGVLLAGLAITSPLTAQAASGSSFKLFGLLLFIGLWSSFVPHVVPAGSGPLVIPGMDTFHGARLAALLVVSIMAQYAFVLAGIGLLRRRGERGKSERRLNTLVVFLVASFVIGAVMAMTIDHPGASEIYFARTGTPFGILLGVWGLTHAVDRAREAHSDRTIAKVVLAAFVTATTMVAAAVLVAPSNRPKRADLAWGLFVPMLAVAVIALIAAAGWWVLRRRDGRALVGTGLVSATTAILATLSIQGPYQTVTGAYRAATGSEKISLPPWHITTNEQVGAQWMIKNTPPDIVAATNVHCFKKSPANGKCEYRSYWLPAFSERRYLVETWAYTEENLVITHTGRGGGFSSFPFDDQEKLRTNDLAFTAPTPQILDTMRNKYGVTWLVADTNAGTVSPELDRLATLRYSNPDIRIYQLK